MIDVSEATRPVNGTKPQADTTTSTARLTASAVFGEVVGLMMSMPAYRHVFLTDLDWMILPPLMLGQYKLYRDKDRPVAFAAWGKLSAEAEARLQEANPRLAPKDWNSGDRIWLINVFAPGSNADVVVADLAKTVFAETTFHMHKTTMTGRVSEVVHGAKITRGGRT